LLSLILLGEPGNIPAKALDILRSHKNKDNNSSKDNKSNNKTNLGDDSSSSGEEKNSKKRKGKLIQFIEKRLKLEIYDILKAPGINDFDGIIYDNNDKMHPITAENTMPAGSILTSKSVYGVIYASGIDRKCQMQQQNVSQKKSHFDQTVSQLLINNVKMLTIMVFICTLCSVWFDPLSQYEIDNYGIFVWLIRAIQNFMIYNGVIPLSLSINLMLSRSMQAVWNFPSYDIRVNNSQLIGDLNNIDYLFSMISLFLT
jgi:magnesium-transporting ATPase (P-type)